MKILNLFLVAILSFFCSCTTAERKAVLSDAENILGKIAVASLTSVVQQEINGGKIDYVQAASSAAYSALTLDNFKQIINDATGNQVPTLATTAAEIASDLVKTKKISQTTAIQTVAAVMSVTSNK